MNHKMPQLSAGQVGKSRIRSVVARPIPELAPVTRAMRLFHFDNLWDELLIN